MVSNRILREANGAYLFNESYQIVHSLLLLKLGCQIGGLTSLIRPGLMRSGPVVGTLNAGFALCTLRLTYA